MAAIANNKSKSTGPSSGVILFGILAVLVVVAMSLSKDDQQARAAPSTPAPVAIPLAIARPDYVQPPTAPSSPPPVDRVAEQAQAERGIARLRKAMWGATKKGRGAFPAIELHPQAYTVARITVADAWVEMNGPARKLVATKLWNAWVIAVDGQGNPDHWRISIVDSNGEEQGGSRLIAGSMIWVND
jgi:hypothetical protein